MNVDRYPLPETEPEKIGLSRRNILDFIDDIEQKRINMHSFLMIRHGRIFGEGYWKPFHQGYLHRLYSVSKSFTSTAVGLLCDEGKIAVTDKVIKYFPEYDESKVDPRVAKCTLRDLLTMSSPFICPAYIFPDGSPREKWIESFFTVTPEKEPGTHFDYDTCGTYILDVIVERVSGKSLMEYLVEKFGADFGFTGTTWCVQSPDGHSWGGSGVMATTRDLGKVGLLWLRGGEWNGRQVLSREYVKEATSRQIENYETDPNYGGFGYGYQIWLTRDNSFSFRGMGSQLAIMVPDKDLVFVCTGDTQGRDDADGVIYELLWKHIVNNLTDGEVRLSESAKRELDLRLPALTLPWAEGAYTSPYIDRYNGKKFELEENPMGIRWFRLLFDGSYGELRYENAQGEKKYRFGLGMNVEDRFPQEGYFGGKIFEPVNGYYISHGSGAWISPDMFRLQVLVTDISLGNMTADFIFTDGGKKVRVRMRKNAEWFLDEYNGDACGALAE